MIGFLAAAILGGHAIVHGVMWSLPYGEAARSDLPMDPAHSWLIGDARGFGLGLALAAAAAFLDPKVIDAFASVDRRLLAPRVPKCEHHHEPNAG